MYFQTAEPTKKVKSKDNGLLFSISDGGTAWVLTTSSARALVVRTHQP